jgi:serine/threonine protein kinase
MSGTLGGRYRIIKPLGVGGFGHTFLAEDTHLPGHPPCVIKQLMPQSADPFFLQTAKRLFDTEAQVLHKLGEHQQIPKLFAHFEENQEFYLVEEFIDGNVLGEEIKNGQQWNETQVIKLLLDILIPLAFVHQHQVIHRDLKPANLIRRKQDSKIVLIDFGAVKEILSQATSFHGQSSLTVAIGTPGYAPNEQSNGKPTLSSDIYAVGIIAIQALTGLHPNQLPDDPSTGEIVWRNHTQVSPKLAEILNKMVRYDFRQRYQSAEEALQVVGKLKSRRKVIVSKKLIGVFITLLLPIVIGVVIFSRSIDMQQPKNETLPKKDIPAF